jgi:hypothetical protein
LGERLDRTQEVVGSIPIGSTIPSRVIQIKIAPMARRRLCIGDAALWGAARRIDKSGAAT